MAKMDGKNGLRLIVEGAVMSSYLVELAESEGKLSRDDKEDLEKAGGMIREGIGMVAVEMDIDVNDVVKMSRNAIAAIRELLGAGPDLDPPRDEIDMGNSA